MPRVKNVDNVAPVKRLEAAEQQVGQGGAAVLSSSGEAHLEQPKIDPVEGPDALAHAEELAFMEEPVTVTVHESNEERAAPYAEIHVNGRTQLFPRGQSITVKRKYVEGLARAKPTGYRDEEYLGADGMKAHRYHKSTALRFPFSVDEDTPKGKAWLKKILAEAA
jgi:hypothetical protein